MARRRFYRNKYSPDRGWVVGFNNFGFVHGDGGPTAAIATVFDFADIDADALTGRVEQDKSDWFIKRVILDVYSAVSFDGTTPTDVARIWQLGMGTANNDAAAELVSNPQTVLSGEAYNHMARTFRTWTRPVYAGGIVPYAANPFAIAVDATEPNVVSSWSTMAPFWGPSSIHEDFEVSNAGLRNNQSCIFHCSTSEGPASFDWDNLDQLYLTCLYRVLLQKRRT